MTFILEKEHQNDFFISNIKDPIIREICFLGFVIIEENSIDFKLKLYDKDKKKFEIDLFDFKNILCGLKIIKGFHLNGGTYSWISDANGDGDKFRNFILSHTGALAGN
jgi:hypothetical protein